MTEEVARFYSDGLQIDASFYWPEDSVSVPAPPVVVVCSGFMGLKSIHPARFARFCTKKGYLCFALDYRGFGKSAGVRGQVLLEENLNDTPHAWANSRKEEIF